MALCLFTLQLCHGHVEVVKLLLGKAGVEVNAATGDGTTPLHVAAMSGHGEVVKLLLGTAEIEVHAAIRDGYTPLHCAAFKGHRDVCLCLLTHGLIRKENRATGAQAILTEYTPLLDSVYAELPENNHLRALFSENNRGAILKMIEQRLAELVKVGWCFSRSSLWLL